MRKPVFLKTSLSWLNAKQKSLESFAMWMKRMLILREHKHIIKIKKTFLCVCVCVRVHE